MQVSPQPHHRSPEDIRQYSSNKVKVLAQLDDETLGQLSSVLANNDCRRKPRSEEAAESCLRGVSARIHRGENVLIELNHDKKSRMVSRASE